MGRLASGYPDGRARRPAVVLVACCAVLLGIGAAFAAGRSQGNALDRPIDAWLIGRLGSHVGALTTITGLGTPVALIIFTVILIAICLATGRPNGAVLTAVSVPVASAITELLKTRVIVMGVDPYTLEPAEEGTLVTSYYDWSSIDPVWKEAGIFPVLSEGALRATLGILARTVARGAAATP